MTTEDQTAYTLPDGAYMTQGFHPCWIAFGKAYHQSGMVVVLDANSTANYQPVTTTTSESWTTEERATRLAEWLAACEKLRTKYREREEAKREAERLEREREDLRESARAKLTDDEAWACGLDED